eukprot:scaffold146_cov171-Ochromonas_danica.AAC.17
MGSGASSIARVRKALLIRAYNLRPPDQNLLQFFLSHAFRGSDRQMYIKPSQIKLCLGMNNDSYFWLDDLLITIFPSSISQPSGISSSSSSSVSLPAPPPDSSTDQQPRINSVDTQNEAKPETVLAEDKLSYSSYPAPPAPPSSSSHTDDSADEVISIDLGRVSSQTLPPMVKLRDDRSSSDSVALTVHSSQTIQKPMSRGFPSQDALDKKQQVWRKQEVVRQERTVHYTTVDDTGALQELVEKEITQTEILHMECRDTGEFAHRETTRYEQQEMFNKEVVQQIAGQEEYVHLKSLEDEFHYMDSTMPPKQPPPDAAPASSASDERGEETIREQEGEQEAPAGYMDGPQDDNRTVVPDHLFGEEPVDDFPLQSPVHEKHQDSEEKDAWTREECVEEVKVDAKGNEDIENINNMDIKDERVIPTNQVTENEATMNEQTPVQPNSGSLSMYDID